jgi:PTH1 family peptidyl-tRNA hydrolase
MSEIKLLVGLGNPGNEYRDTRHNAGFWLVDALVRALGIEGTEKEKYNSLFYAVKRGKDTLLLQKPLTYMNRSGAAVLPVMQFYKLKPADVLAAHDELDLPVGRMRLKQGGGSGGHNGLKSLDAAIGKEYRRLRIGIGRPAHAEHDVSAYVLGKCPSEDAAKIGGIADFLTSQLDLLLDSDKHPLLMNRFAERFFPVPTKPRTFGTERAITAKKPQHKASVGMKCRVDVRLKDGVLDPQGSAVLASLKHLGYGEARDVRVGRMVELVLDGSDPEKARARVQGMCDALLANGVIEDYEISVEPLKGQSV